MHNPHTYYLPPPPHHGQLPHSLLYLLSRLQKVSKLCSETSFQSTQTLLCATSSSNSLLVTSPSQNRLQTVSNLLNFSDSSPAHLSGLLTVYTPSRQLRSSADKQLLRIPHVKTNTSGQCSISYCASNYIPSVHLCVCVQMCE